MPQPNKCVLEKLVHQCQTGSNSLEEIDRTTGRLFDDPTTAASTVISWDDSEVNFRTALYEIHYVPHLRTDLDKKMHDAPDQHSRV